MRWPNSMFYQNRLEAARLVENHKLSELGVQQTNTQQSHTDCLLLSRKCCALSSVDGASLGADRPGRVLRKTRGLQQQVLLKHS